MRGAATSLLVASSYYSSSFAFIMAIVCSIASVYADLPDIDVVLRRSAPSGAGGSTSTAGGVINCCGAIAGAGSEGAVTLGRAIGSIGGNGSATAATLAGASTIGSWVAAGASAALDAAIS